MRDCPDLCTVGPKNLLGALHGKAPYPDHPLRVQHFDDALEMAITRGEQLRHFRLRQLVGSPIEAALLHEGEWTIVDDKVLFKELRRFAEALREQSPKPLPADLASRTIEPEHDAFRMFDPWFADFRAQLHPLADGIYFAE